MPLAVDIDSEDFLGLSYGLFFFIVVVVVKFFSKWMVGMETYFV